MFRSKKIDYSKLPAARIVRNLTPVGMVGAQTGMVCTLGSRCGCAK